MSSPPELWGSDPYSSCARDPWMARAGGIRTRRATVVGCREHGGGNPLESLALHGNVRRTRPLIDHDNLEEYTDPVDYDWRYSSDTGVAFYSALAREAGG